MNNPTIETNQLSGKELDLWVAKATGRIPESDGCSHTTWISNNPTSYDPTTARCYGCGKSAKQIDEMRWIKRELVRAKFGDSVALIEGKV